MLEERREPSEKLVIRVIKSRVFVHAVYAIHVRVSKVENLMIHDSILELYRHCLRDSSAPFEPRAYKI